MKFNVQARIHKLIAGAYQVWQRHTLAEYLNVALKEYLDPGIKSGLLEREPL
ncbi:MAG: hypothetical protein PHD36_03395 [Desulfotomaculaceae bacterium]|nr:hypothetical protein [Desulfotomaculaceae bacterium]